MRERHCSKCGKAIINYDAYKCHNCGNQVKKDSKCCFNCRYRVYKGSETFSEDYTLLPNAEEDYGEIGKNLLIPADDDNPAFLMRSTDGKVRQFHGRFNQCVVTKENIDIAAQQEINSLLNSRDYVCHKGTIYSLFEDYSGLTGPRNIYQPSDQVLADYYMSRRGLSDAPGQKLLRYDTISGIINYHLFEKGRECENFKYNKIKPIAEKKHETVIVKGRKINIM